MGSSATVELSDGAGHVGGTANAPKARRAVALALEFLGRRDLDARLKLGEFAAASQGHGQQHGRRGGGHWRDGGGVGHGNLGAAPSRPGAGRGAERRRDAARHRALRSSRTAAFHSRWASRLAIRVLALEFTDAVDTEAFNAVDRRAELRSHASRFREALDLITVGLADGDARLIGEGATLSSLANQELLPKPQLDVGARPGANRRSGRRQRRPQRHCVGVAVCRGRRPHPVGRASGVDAPARSGRGA